MSAETRPININEFQLAIKDLSDDNLMSVKDQLMNSVSKLLDTNSILETEIVSTKEQIANLKESDSHQELKDELQLYTESIEENQIVIRNQRERLRALNEELNKRGLDQENLVNEEKDKDEEKGIYL